MPLIAIQYFHIKIYFSLPPHTHAYPQRQKERESTMRIFARVQHRALALVSNDYCLTLRYVSEAQQCLIQYTPLSQTDLTGFEEIPDRTFLGLTGILSMKKTGLVFISVITDSVHVGSPRPGENIYKVKDVEFYCLNSSEFDTLTRQRFKSDHDWEKYDTEHPCSKIRRRLTSGFYYSRDFDLTNVLQERGLQLHDYEQMYGSFDRKFLWNHSVIEELLRFRDRIMENEKKYLDQSELIVLLIRGFVKTVQINGTSGNDLMTIISKVSCARQEDSLGLSGVDEDGHVSNYIESEILYCNQSNLFAYTQVRGNVPLFYEIENPFLSNKKITFTQSKELNELAFEKHFDSVFLKHGNVVVLNSLKSRGVEEELNNRFKYFLNKKNFTYIDINFTRDALKKSSDRLTYLLENALLEIGAFCYDIKQKVYIGKQLGVFRINSLNSMEKPGLIEKHISFNALELSLNEMGETEDHIQFYSDLKRRHDSLWDENNQALIAIYEKSLSKNWRKTFDGIASKVSLYDPFYDYISTELKKRSKEYSSASSISLLTGSFNVNGETPDQDISTWIHPFEAGGVNHDIVVIGLEEVVELTTSKMLVTDDTKKKFWATKIKRSLNTNGSKYSLVWSNQLGGIVLLLFVRDDQISQVKEINGMVKKTGFGGYSANKGGVAISFLYSSTRFCFLASHLAAGLENNEQRRNDYKTIARAIRFSHDRRIKDHDSIVWLGDFNYRILLPNEKVREMINSGRYTELFEYDQLNNQMIAGESFPYFNEMEIKFPPTYKFDKGTKTYDTSDKLRIPAWTDRIISRGSNLTQLSYNSAQDLTFSDHRPVYATFKAQVKIINEDLKHKLTKELYEIRKRQLDQNGINNVETLMLQQRNQAIENKLTLPPPSSDKSKWWITGGLQVKVNLEVPPNASVFNPLRPSNPFIPTDEPDFI